jgi:hypothetical protein
MIEANLTIYIGTALSGFALGALYGRSLARASTRLTAAALEARLEALERSRRGSDGGPAPAGPGPQYVAALAQLAAAIEKHAAAIDDHGAATVAAAVESHAATLFGVAH